MLMGSFNSSHHQEEEEDQDQQQYQAAAGGTDLEIYQQQPISSGAPPPNAIQLRQLLINCAQLISQSDFGAAHRVVSVLLANSSPYGDSMERLVHQFARALFLRLSNYCQQQQQQQQMMMSMSMSYAATSSSSTASRTSNINISTGQGAQSQLVSAAAAAADDDVQALHSCYLTLNQITPFIRFCHLTANQAILEAIDEGQRALHILDLDIMHGLQWPPFMQALVERTTHPMLRITATGHDLALLHRTGERLLRFAQSLGLRFQFHPLLIPGGSEIITNIPSSLSLLPDEALAVNCVLYLHRLLLKDEDCSHLRLFLHSIKALNPKVVTIAERELSHSHQNPDLIFVDALDHYAAIFDSLEATLPPNSRDRRAVEQIWFGREIIDVVGHVASCWRRSGSSAERARFESWEIMLRSSGFCNVPLSPFALSQAKLLLRLHYPSEGFHLHILDHSFFLGWQNRSLFSVSSWH